MTAGTGTASALVLAGKRDGRVDPLAVEAAVSHKCLVPVAGMPMIAHVIHALASSSHIREILVSIDDAAVLRDVAEIRGHIGRGKIIFVPARPNIVDSVLEGAARARFPMLVTTADNVLLSPQSIGEVVAQASANRFDAAVAFTRRESVLAAHPDGQRRFYRFSEASYSNCNTYWIGNREALRAAEVFRSGGQFAKHPLRIVGSFGLLNLVRFRFGIGTLVAAFARFSRRLGIRIAPVILSDGAVAIDVDNERSRAIAEGLLEARAELARAAE